MHRDTGEGCARHGEAGRSARSCRDAVKVVAKVQESGDECGEARESGDESGKAWESGSAEHRKVQNLR